MQLHLTINEKLVGSIPISSSRRHEPGYIDQMKQQLLLRFSSSVKKGAVYSFYLDPSIVDLEVSGNGIQA